MAKLVSFATCFKFKVWGLSRSNVLGSLSWATPSSTPSSSASAALAETIAKSRSKSQSFLNCLLFRTRHEKSMTGTRPSTFSSMTPMSGRMMAYHQPAKRSYTPVPCIGLPLKEPQDSSRMYGENGWCRASTFTSATSSARVNRLLWLSWLGCCWCDDLSPLQFSASPHW